MTLDDDVCWNRLAAARRAVLCTAHAERGVDAVPATFAVLADRRIVIPVDTVKPKATTALQRAVNVERDPRCALLVDHYDDDWSELWWVRVHATARRAPLTPDAGDALARRYPQYGAPGAVVELLVLTPWRVTGWAATAPAP